jgi:hypothetical protein
MVDNENTGHLDARGVSDTFASMLAPTGDPVGRTCCEHPESL